jgi:hypothetical protein
MKLTPEKKISSQNISGFGSFEKYKVGCELRQGVLMEHSRFKISVDLGYFKDGVHKIAPQN